MSEHIIETEMFGSTAFVTIPPKEPKEEIVRCRDCEYASYDSRWCYRPTNVDVLSIRPDGYCAWGERK